MKKLFTILLPLLLLAFAERSYSQQTIANMPRKLTPNGMFDKVFDRFGAEYALADLNLRSPKFGNQTYTISSVPTESCIAGKFKLFFSPNSIVFCQATQSLQAQTVMCEVYSNISGFIVSNIPDGSINIFCDDGSGGQAQATSFYAYPSFPSNNNQGIVDGLVYKALTSGVDPYSGIPISTFNTGSVSAGFYHGTVLVNPGGLFNFSLTTPTVSSNETLFYGIILHEAIHTLGFASLIGPTGASNFSATSNFYSRYDQFLRNANGIPLLSSATATGCPNSNITFSSLFSPTASICQSTLIGATSDGTTNCLSAVQYSSNNTLSKVYTPFNFEPGSSLSHFEDMCTWPTTFVTTCTPTPSSPGYNNLYFVMANWNNSGDCYVKRYLKQEEKQVLCDLGYTLSGLTFTSNTFGATHTYSSGCMPTATVIGLNDGYNNGVYSFTTTSTQTVIPFTALVSNDIPNTASVTCLELIYNTATLSPSASDFTISAALGAGVVIVKYLPINSLGQLGNVTYVYVYFSPGVCNPSNACNKVQNGGFESISQGNPLCGIIGSYQWPNFPAPGAVQLQVSCWEAYQLGPHLHKTNCNGSSGFFNLGTSSIYNTTVSSFNGAANTNVLGLTYSSFSGNGFVGASSIKNNLSSPLVPNQTYQFSLWVINHKSPSLSSVLNSNNSPVVITIASNPAFAFTPTLNFPSGLTTLTEFTVNASDVWTQVTNTFVFPSTVPSSSTIVIGINDIKTSSVPNSTTSGLYYCFIDEINLLALPSPTFVLPTVPNCSIATFTNLAQYASGVPGTFSGVGVNAPLGIYNFNSPPTYTAGTFPIAFTYTDIGNNNCTNTVWQTVTQSQIGLSTSGNTVICTTTGGSSVTIGANQTSSLSGVSYSWQPGNLSGSALLVNPTVTTIYTVTAFNASGCSASQTLAVFVYSNCCGPSSLTAFSQPTVVPNTTLGSCLVTNDFTVQAGTLSLTGDLKFLNNIKITVAANATLQISGAHLSACTATMWQGIIVQDGGQLQTFSVSTDNLIEDAITAIDVSNHITSTLTTILDIKNTTFNKNYLGINIANYQRTNPSFNDAFKIKNSVFTCRSMTANATQWPSTSVNDLRAAVNTTTGLAPPYLGNNTTTTLLSPHIGETSTIAINLDLVGIAASGNYNGITIGSSVTPEFNVFDNHVTFIRSINSNLHSINNVFQNTKNISSWASHGSAIYSETTFSAVCNYLDVTSAGSTSTGNKFWNCHRGIEGKNVYAFNINFGIFRSTQSYSNSISTFLPGNTGILLTTNRLRYFVTTNEFTNIKTAINIPLAFGPTTLVPVSNFGIYASNISIVGNSFKRGSGSNSFMNRAIEISAAIGGTWTIGTYTAIAPNTIGVIIENNTLTDVYRGIYVYGMRGFKTRIKSNDITLIDDPDNNQNSQHAINLFNTINNAVGQSVITENNLKSSGTNSLSNSRASLMYCGLNLGASLQSPSITCNVLKDSYCGFLFEIDNQGARWLGNHMTNHKYGMYQLNNGWIGIQGSNTLAMANAWLGTWVNGVNYGIYTDNTDAFFSSLYVATSSTPSFPPNLDGIPTISNYVNFPPNVISGSASWNCVTPQSYVTNPQLPNAANFTDANLYYIQQTASYRFFKDNDSIRTSNGSFESFYSNLAGSSIAAFTELDDLIALGNLSSVSSLLASITATNTVERQYKTYYRLYLIYAANNFSPTDSKTDETDLISLAGSCAGTDGASVYQARALRNLVFRDARSYPICQNFSAKLQKDKEQISDESNFAIQIYPNPATNHLTIYSNIKDRLLEVKICDLSSRTVLKTTIKQNGFLANLELNLIEGAYIIYLTERENTILTKKLIVGK